MRVSTVTEFVEKVIYDGRHLADFTEKPREVAQRLNIEAPEEVYSELSHADRLAIIARTTKEMTNNFANRVVAGGGPFMAGPTVGVGLDIAIIGLAIGVYAVVEVCKKTPVEDNVVDMSPLAAQKI